MRALKSVAMVAVLILILSTIGNAFEARFGGRVPDVKRLAMKCKLKVGKTGNIRLKFGKNGAPGFGGEPGSIFLDTTESGRFKFYGADFDERPSQVRTRDSALPRDPLHDGEWNLDAELGVGVPRRPLGECESNGLLSCDPPHRASG